MIDPNGIAIYRQWAEKARQREEFKGGDMLVLIEEIDRLSQKLAEARELLEEAGNSDLSGAMVRLLKKAEGDDWRQKAKAGNEGWHTKKFLLLEQKIREWLEKK